MTTPEWNNSGHGGYGGQYDPAYGYPGYAPDQHLDQHYPPEQTAAAYPPPSYGYETYQAQPAPAEQPYPLPQPAPEPEPAPAPAPTLRTGSPIIPPGIQPALLTAVLAALTAAGAALGSPALAVAAVLLQAVTAAGWFRLNGMWPARQGIALAFLAGLAADVGLLAAPADQAPSVILGALGVWILLILVQQMRHQGSADERLSSLTATAASTALTVLAAGYLAIDGKAGSHPVVVGAVAVAVATVARALPLPSAVSVVVALLAAAGSGVATDRLTGMGTTSAVLIAVAAGVCALIGLRVASYDFPSRFVHFTAGVALPLTAAAPVVYVLGRALGS
ncbi:hypothetical protein [Streptantibioticus ferralitis]|uniref:Integral membrane protein n=1 Tax=Streptantibioticus ferralitis TaxID=236510 RepID=A0ABT5Z6A6_9ACTN|nr:hypothetical protein [Streptantibioticus ferralitis]MDF2259340.1 hypothetical protein [Streptantibioticus ferralitis]